MAFLLEPENSPLDSFSFTAFHFKDANIHRPGRKLWVSWEKGTIIIPLIFSKILFYRRRCSINTDCPHIHEAEMKQQKRRLGMIHIVAWVCKSHLIARIASETHLAKWNRELRIGNKISTSKPFLKLCGKNNSCHSGQKDISVPGTRIILTLQASSRAKCANGKCYPPS